MDLEAFNDDMHGRVEDATEIDEFDELRQYLDENEDAIYADIIATVAAMGDNTGSLEQFANKFAELNDLVASLGQVNELITRGERGEFDD